jgi:hypothetical protein
MAIIPEGDVDPQITYAAVGEALTAWEGFEESLSAIFTVLDGSPGDLEVYRQYGEDGHRFAVRAELIRKAGDKFFRKNPCQKNEGDLTALLTSAIDAARLRNKIAHGIVIEVTHCPPTPDGKWQEPFNRFHLSAPWFSTKRLRAGFPGLGSAAIKSAGTQFRKLEETAEELVRRIHLPKA